MKLCVVIGTLLSLLVPAAAQRHKLTINAETPEGQMLQAIGQEQDDAKKLTMLEGFAGKYPKHEAMAWVYAQMQPVYVKTGQFDKAIDAGEKSLALEPGDIEVALAALKASETKKDPDLILKWSETTSAIARKTTQGQKPADEEDEQWKRQVDYAQQVDTYTEYALYAASLTCTDPAKTIALVEALEKRNAQSQYLAQAYGPYSRALIQTKNPEKAAAVAEKALAKNPNDEDMMLAVADYNLNKQQNPDKVLSYAQKAAEVIEAKQKPAGVDDAAWAQAKKTKLGLAHWYAGMAQVSTNKYGAGDAALRKALPLTDGNEQLKAAVLFNLGLANFRIGEASKAESNRIVDALKFYQQCAAIKGPYQATAQKNVTAIKSQYRIR